MAGSTQGSSNRGNSEQHAEAGRRGGEASHGGGGNESGVQRDGSSEQHAEAGRQSHKGS